MGIKYFSKQLILFFVAWIIIISVLLFFHFCPWIHEEVILITEKDNRSIFITADGLITTSTFAFVAFSSLSPSSSGSSIVVRRLEWSGLWIFRNSFLLILSVLLTLASSFTIEFDSTFMFVSLFLSSIIVIFIILRYRWYYRNSEKKAGDKFEKIIKYIHENHKLDTHIMEKEIKKILRPFINPLKGSHNVDLIRVILSSDLMSDLFYMKFINKMGYQKKTEFIFDKKSVKLAPHFGITKKEDLIFDRLLLPSKYGILRTKEKAYLAISMVRKMVTVAEKCFLNHNLEEKDLFEYMVFTLFTRSPNDNKNEVLIMVKKLYEQRLVDKQNVQHAKKVGMSF